MPGLLTSVRSWAHRPVVYLTVFIALLIGAGVAGYAIGSSSGADLEAARHAGAAAGENEGSAKAVKEGYARGLEPGRSQGFADAYPTAYEAAYLREFRDAGLDAPARVSVPDPPSSPGGEG